MRAARRDEARGRAVQLEVQALTALAHNLKQATLIVHGDDPRGFQRSTEVRDPRASTHPRQRS